MRARLPRCRRTQRVNDEQGHDVGDTLISDVAHLLRATLRESDILARMGGEEFCVLGTEGQGDPAMLKERVVEAFRRFNEASDRPYRLSARIGLVQAPAADTATVDQLLARAAELMYAEKKASRNSRLAIDQV